MPLSANLRKYRFKAKLSQEALARLADVCFMTISRIERGKQSPSVEILQRIAKALSVSLDDLAGKN